jgi:hypothetical protein
VPDHLPQSGTSGTTQPPDPPPTPRADARTAPHPRKPGHPHTAPHGRQPKPSTGPLNPRDSPPPTPQPHQSAAKPHHRQHPTAGTRPHRNQTPAQREPPHHHHAGHSGMQQGTSHTRGGRGAKTQGTQRLTQREPPGHRLQPAGHEVKPHKARKAKLNHSGGRPHAPMHPKGTSAVGEMKERAASRQEPAPTPRHPANSSKLAKQPPEPLNGGLPSHVHRRHRRVRCAQQTVLPHGAYRGQAHHWPDTGWRPRGGLEQPNKAAAKEVPVAERDPQLLPNGGTHHLGHIAAMKHVQPPRLILRPPRLVARLPIMAGAAAAVVPHASRGGQPVQQQAPIRLLVGVVPAHTPGRRKRPRHTRAKAVVGRSGASRENKCRQGVQLGLQGRPLHRSEQKERSSPHKQSLHRHHSARGSKPPTQHDRARRLARRSGQRQGRGRRQSSGSGQHAAQSGRQGSQHMRRQRCRHPPTIPTRKLAPKQGPAQHHPRVSRGIGRRSQQARQPNCVAALDVLFNGQQPKATATRRAAQAPTSHPRKPGAAARRLIAVNQSGHPSEEAM